MAKYAKSRRKVEPAVVLNSQVARALSVIGDRWAFLIIRDVYLGVRQFEELRKRTGAARGTLSSRLHGLVDNGILYRNPYQTAPLRYEYRLTDKGMDLYPLVLATWNWETKWGDGENLPPELIHTTCGNSLRPIYRCGHCCEEIALLGVTYEQGANSLSAKKIPPRFQRRSKSKEGSHPDVDRRFFHVVDVLGDRWTALVVACSYFGVTRFDDIVHSIGIATNILSDRLKVLLNVGVLVRKPYQENPIRYEYRLSEKGHELYPTAVAMHEWASKWLLSKGEQPLKLRHRKCDKPLKPEIVCNHCEKELVPGEVMFQHSFEQQHAV